MSFRLLAIGFSLLFLCSTSLAQAHASTTPNTSVIQQDTNHHTLPSDEAALRLGPGLAILFNFLPFTALGVGSFLQGDLRGGLTIFGSTVVGSLLASVAIAVFGLSLGSGNPAAMTFFLLGSGLIVFSIVWSVLAPLRFARKTRRMRKRRMPGRRGRGGIWSNDKPVLPLQPLLAPVSLPH